MAITRDYFQRFGLSPRGRRSGLASFGGPAIVRETVPVDPEAAEMELIALAKQAGLTVEEYKRYALEAARKAADLAAKALDTTSGTTSTTAATAVPAPEPEKKATSPLLWVVGAFVAWKLLK